MDGRKLIRALALTLALLAPVCAEAGNVAMVAGGTVPAPGGDTTYCTAGNTGLFCSDLEDQTDDAQWTGATGFNADYTTDVLAQTESGFCEGDSTTAAVRSSEVTFTGTENATVYARTMFKIKSYGAAGGSSAFGLYLSSSGTIMAECNVTTDADTVNDLNAKDSAGSSSVNPADKSMSDATYYLYLIYNDDTSVQCQILDANFSLVTGWDITNSTNPGEVPDKLGVYVYRRDTDVAIDNVEVREDTTWGE